MGRIQTFYNNEENGANEIIDDLYACPSNYFNCDCYGRGDRGQSVVDVEEIWLPENYFQLNAGLCGMPKMDFYKRGDGRWEFYVNNGDGTLQGTCWPNEADAYCYPSWNHGTSIADRLVCYSYVCGS